MAKHDIEKQIKDRVEIFVNELSDLVRHAAFESVQEALTGIAGPKRRGRPRKTNKASARRPAVKRKGKKTGKRAKRSGEQVDAVAAKILAHVKANPGTGVTDMGAALRMSPKEMRLPILRLLEQKKLRTTGQRRGMKYHARGRGGATAKPATRKRAAKKGAKRKAPRRKTGKRKKVGAKK